MTTNETIGYCILTAFLIWLAVQYWVMPGKIASIVGKLIIAVFMIWVIGNMTYTWAAYGWTQAFTIWQLLILAMAGFAFWLLGKKQGKPTRHS